jgi:hypothetical protein
MAGGATRAAGYHKKARHARQEKSIRQPFRGAL